MAVVGMPVDEFKGASPNAHLLVGEMPAPHTLQTSSWQATAASFGAHLLVLGLLIYGALHVKQIAQAVKDVPMTFTNVIMTPQPGPGGGGGGRPEPKPEPPKKAEIVQQKPVEVKPIPKPSDVPIPDLNVPFQTPSATTTVAGAVSMDANGLGIPGGGRGTGIGTGTGSGIGPGTGGGTGGGVYQPGNGITDPVLIHEVKPNYTGDAMRAKLQGVVEMDAVVNPDGTVDSGSLKITRSLDATFGLDEEAKKAVRQWRFRPAMCTRQDGCNGIARGQAVKVLVSVELTFTLR
jgi:protein TonB